MRTRSASALPKRPVPMRPTGSSFWSDAMRDAPVSALPVLAREHGVCLIVVHDPLLGRVEMDRSSGANSDICKVSRGGGAVSDVDVGVWFVAGFDAIDPVLEVLLRGRLGHAVECRFERPVALAAELKLAALAKKHVAFRADVLGAAVDIER